MSTSPFDGWRPPEQPRRRRRARPQQSQQSQQHRGDGSREMPVVPDTQFSSYYGRPIVKAAPWETDVAAYLFFGGLAAGSGLLAAGAQLTGWSVLRRNCRFAALGAAGVGTVALIRDLGRPERFLNMLRTIKVTSPMNLGSWLLVSFSAGIGVTVAAEVDRMSGCRFPLGPLRRPLYRLEGPGGLGAGLLGSPLAAYTAILLADTATPTWNEAREDLPLVFAASASMAAGGLAMVTTPVAHTRPARILATIGALGDLVASEVMQRRMDPIAAEPLQLGRAGAMLQVSTVLAVAGGVGAVFGGRRSIAVAGGAALLAASALNRLGIFQAGIHSANDPRYTVEPQKRRLARRRAAGTTDDSITTVD